jgi:hypothetical protein
MLPFIFAVYMNSTIFAGVRVFVVGSPLSLITDQTI